MNLKTYIEQKAADRPVYMPYLTVGDPDFDSTLEFAIAMIDAGADLLELGIPFSDPTADGPVIQRAMVRAMARTDFSLEKVLETVGQIHRARPEIPIVFLTYLNPVMNGFPGYQNTGATGRYENRETAARLSITNFLNECVKVGVKGLVIPDLPFHELESKIIREVGAPMEVDQIQMIAPTTDQNRKEKICKYAAGFIYYVTSTGVTGERKEFPPDMKDKIAEVKKLSGVPVIAGFGFNRPEQMVGLKGIMDGIIVGSYNHTVIEEEGKQAAKTLIQNTKSFVEALSR